MTSAVLFSIPVGLSHTLEPVAERRTPAQRERVAAILADSEFDFACDNPFTEEVSPSYRGPFAFLYYTRDGRLHLERIGARGDTLRHVVPDSV